MSNSYTVKNSTLPVRRPTEGGPGLQKSDTALSTELQAGRSLRGMLDAGQVSETEARALVKDLGQGIRVADEAEQQAKRVASPESQAEGRKMASTREAGLAAALHSRLPAEQIAATDLTKMEAAQLGLEAVTTMEPVVTQMENLAAARSTLGREIAGLEAKQPRTAGEEMLLQAKRHQAESLDATSGVLRDRIDILKATKDAALNREAGGGLAINEDEAASLAAATRATDVAALAVASKGRAADAEVALAVEAVRREGETGGKTLTPAASNAEVTAQATGVEAPAGGKKLPAGEPYTVQPGDWLTKIAANHRNADGSRVTLEQLLDTPGNENYRKNPNLIHPGDVVRLPAGAVRAEGGAANEVKKPAPEEANASVETRRADPRPTGKPRVGLSTTKPMDAAQINESVARSNAQTQTLNRMRQGVLDDGVGGLDARVDPKRISRDADQVIARHEGRLAEVNRVGSEIDAEIKTLSARTNRTPGETALLEAKRAQRNEVNALAGAIEGSISGLRELKVEASDGRINDTEAKAIVARYQAKQSAIASSVQAGMVANDKLAQAYEQMRRPTVRSETIDV